MQWVSSPTAEVDKGTNYKFLLDYLATFTGNLPTQAEVEAMVPGFHDTILFWFGDDDRTMCSPSMEEDANIIICCMFEFSFIQI